MDRKAWVALAAAALMAGCGGGDDDNGGVKPSYRATNCPAFEGLPPAVRVSCGTLTVAQTRSGSNRGRKVELAVFRLSRTDRPSTATPLLWLQGGPGEAASVDVLTWAESSTLQVRDVIFFDQRGTGLSTPALSCPELQRVRVGHFTAPRIASAEVAAARDAARQCVRRYSDRSVDLQAFNSIETAHDVGDLRAQLGIAQWHVYGVSYGTRAALAVMRYAPQGLASVVLDSGAPTDLPTALRVQAADAQVAVGRLFARCAADAACAQDHGDLSRKFEQMVQRFNAAPWLIRRPVDGSPTQLTVTGNDLAQVVILLQKDSEALELLPAFIATLADGDTAIAEPIVSGFLDGRLDNSQDFITTQLAVDCNDLKRLSNAQDAAFDLAPGRWQLGALVSSGPYCDLVPGSGNPADYNQPVVSSVPTLLLAGELDPVSLPERTRQAGSALLRKTFVQIPGAGHVPGMGTECGRNLVDSFFANPAAFVTPPCASAAPGS